MTLFDGDEAFVRSRDKFEAVNRIAALTGTGPEDLGPGSKERKRVLENVVHHFGFDIDTSLSKTQLGEAIVVSLGGRWEPSFWSRGETITLAGLDRVLELATRRAATPAPPGSHEPSGVEDEAARIIREAALALPRTLEMRTCVEQMREAENSNWAQNEWVGFYFEAVARARCQSVLGGEPGGLYGRTRFDYRWIRTWDFKAHTEVDRKGKRSYDMLLNDIEAVRACVGDGGLGFVVLHGVAEFDEEGALRTWHAALRSDANKKSRTTTTGRPSRVYKSTFTPTLVEAVMLRDIDAVEGAIEEGWLAVMRQGQQISGRPRKPKFLLRRRGVPGDHVLASHTFGASPT